MRVPLPYVKIDANLSKLFIIKRFLFFSCFGCHHIHTVYFWHHFLSFFSFFAHTHTRQCDGILYQPTNPLLIKNWIYSNVCDVFTLNFSVFKRLCYYFYTSEFVYFGFKILYFQVVFYCVDHNIFIKYNTKLLWQFLVSIYRTVVVRLVRTLLACLYFLYYFLVFVRTVQLLLSPNICCFLFCEEMKTSLLRNLFERKKKEEKFEKFLIFFDQKLIFSSR